MSITRRPALIAACVALLAGGGGAAALAATAGASTAGTGSPTGTATVSVTGPAGKTHTRTPKVSCAVSGELYTVTSHKQGKRDRRSETTTLTVADYSGPGSYDATVVITRRTPSSFRERHFTIPVMLTSDGGSVSYSKTFSGKRHKALAGKTVSASANWTCSV
jgi:hypothetical protein